MKLKMITSFLNVEKEVDDIKDDLKALEKEERYNEDHLVLMMTMTIKLGLLEILSHPARRGG